MANPILQFLTYKAQAVTTLVQHDLTSRKKGL